jgi:hypothetical protein
MALGEQRSSGRRELHVGARFMAPEPALGNGEIDAGLVFRRAAAGLEKWGVDQLEGDTLIHTRPSSAYSAMADDTDATGRQGC